jgi:transcriptional regulator with XRE-family HTH domain
LKTLREWRAEKLISSKGLAARSGVSNKTILGIENQRQVPTFRTMDRLSDALQIEPAAIKEFVDALKRRARLSGSTTCESLDISELGPTSEGQQRCLSKDVVTMKGQFASGPTDGGKR